MEPRGCPWRRGAARASPWASGSHGATGAWERPRALDSPYGSAEPPAWGRGPPEPPATGHPPPQAPGMPVPQYPYGEAAAGAAPQGAALQPWLQEDPWAPCAAYGMQPHYPAHGNPCLSNSHPSWSGSGIPPCPLARDSKDCAYEKPEQSGTNPPGCYPGANHQRVATMSEREPPPLAAKAAPSAPKVQYSAQPQMYGARKTPEGTLEAGGRAGTPSSTDPAAIPPEIQRIRHVAEEAEQLEQEVDEFVGKKTEKSYRLLEEMLTKLLLELDSIETGGQDGIRQARKEAVRRIQAMLEKLERKGL